MLAVLLSIPFAVAISVLLFGLTPRAAAAIALPGSLLTLVLAISVYLQYRGEPLGQSFDVSAPWVDALHINFHLGIDGMGVLFVLLTAILTPVAVLVAIYTVTERLQYYLTLLLFLEGALLGVFTALDLVLFYFFWEAVLIPAYFMIGTWGGDRRIYAAFKYVLYTMAGSLLMLVGILLLFAQSSPHSFDLPTLIAAPAGPGRAEAGIPGLCPGIRDQGRAVPLPQLGAGCLHASRTHRPRSSCPGCSARWASTASCGSACRCSPMPSATSPRRSWCYRRSGSYTARCWPGPAGR